MTPTVLRAVLRFLLYGHRRRRIPPHPHRPVPNVLSARLAPDGSTWLSPYYDPAWPGQRPIPEDDDRLW